MFSAIEDCGHRRQIFCVSRLYVRGDVQNFGWSCCHRLPSLGGRRVRITLLVADVPWNTSSRESLRLPRTQLMAHVCFS